MKPRKISRLSAKHSQYQPLYSVERIPSGQALYYDQDLYPLEYEAGEKVNFFQVLWKQAVAVFGVTTVVTAGVYLWTINQTPEYKGSFQILVESPNLTEIEDSLPVENNQALDYNSQVEILQSPKLMSEIIKTIQTRYPEMTYDSLFNQKTGQTYWKPDILSIKPLKNTRIVEVSYQDSEPQKVQFILEKVAEGYLKYSLPADVQAEQREQQLKLIQLKYNF